MKGVKFFFTTFAEVAVVFAKVSVAGYKESSPGPRCSDLGELVDFFVVFNGEKDELGVVFIVNARVWVFCSRVASSDSSSGRMVKFFIV